MLPSEFIERTGVQLETEEYMNVETMYNEVKMNKDDFCKEWKRLHNNPLMKEIVESFAKFRTMEQEISKMKAQLEEKDRVREEMLDEQAKKDGLALMDFTKRIIRANEESKEKVYDVVEEECGLDFICKTKLEEGIELKSHEVNHLIKKLV